MSTNTANALGVQQNFSPDPKAVYQKNLIGTPAGLSGNGAASSGMQLAQALGVLGNSLQNEASAYEDRREKLGISAAEEIVKGQTPENLHKLSAIEMLQNYGHYDVSDNPYAVAMVEKMRGKYFGAKIKDEYTTYRGERSLPKTADEEITQYNSFVQQRFSGLQGVSSDLTAFRKGFFDSDLANQLDVAHGRRKELEVERKAIVTGSTQAAFGEVNSKAMGVDVDAVIKKYNAIFADARLTGTTIPERMEFAKGALKEYAQQTGQADKVDALAKGVVIGVDREGKSVSLASVLDTFDFKNLASQRQTHMFDQRIQSEITRLTKGSKEEANAQYELWKKSDPTFYNSMLPYRDNIYNSQVKREEKDKIKALNDNTTSHLTNASFAVLDQQFRAAKGGMTHDVVGRRVATSPGDLPKIKYTHYNLDGSTVEKEKSISDEHVTAYIDYQLNQLKANQSLTPEQRGAAVVTLLASPVAEKYAKTVKMQMDAALDTLTVDKLTKAENGTAKLSGILEDTFSWYRTNPEAFYRVFGSETSRKLETIQTLSLATGDIKEAVGLYAQGKERAKDKEFVRQTQNNLISAIKSQTLDGFQDLSGNDEMINTALAGNRSIMARVETLAESLIYTGMSTTQALEAAKTAARKTHRVWRDTAFPLSAFNGINSEERGKVGAQVLDYYLKKFVEDTRVDERHIMSTFDADRGVFRLSGGGAFVTYSLNDIAYSGNYLLSKQTTTNLPALTMDEVDNLRQPLPDGSYLVPGTDQ